MTLNQKSRKLCVHYKRHNGTPVFAVFDDEQVKTMLGLFAQSQGYRVECARKLGNCLDHLQRNHSGLSWYDQPVSIAAYTKTGLVVESRPPLPARVCEFVFFACMAQNQFAFECLRGDLWRFSNGDDTWLVRANNLFGHSNKLVALT